MLFIYEGKIKKRRRIAVLDWNRSQQWDLYFGIFLVKHIELKQFLMIFKKSQMIKLIYSEKCLEVLSISTAQNSPS